MATTIKKYYDFTQPQSEAILNDPVRWDGAAPASITIQPGTDEAVFVKSIHLMIDDLFRMTATDVITITVNAYDNTVPQTYTITCSAVAGDEVRELVALGDPALYCAKTVAGTNYHDVTIPFDPPVYLRSSPTVVDSVVVDYTPTGGGVTAGEILITYKAWKCEEDDSGLS